MKILLSDVLENLNDFDIFGSADRILSGLGYDSRTISQDQVFFALGGVHTDGEKFISAAISNGATVIVSERLPQELNSMVTWINVKSIRFFMSAFSDAFYGHPSRDLCVIGVTGTDGKSSTVYYIYQLLLALGEKAGYLSTVGFGLNGMEQSNPFRQSTPESTEIHRLLHEIKQSGAAFAVVETTSHGLSERTARLEHVSFDIGVFTNVTLEHLEFHGSLEQYRKDKSRLFAALGRDTGKTRPRAAIINFSDPHHQLFADVVKKDSVPLISYRADGIKADYFVNDLVTDLKESRFTLRTSGTEFHVYLPLPCAFNVENALAALASVQIATGKPLSVIIEALTGLKPVKGRMTPVHKGQRYSVLVDYAHTPGAFEKVLPMVKAATKGRLICVFGSGGERDLEKRPMQGQLASRWADIIILTDEDPRQENSLKIIGEISAGCVGKTRDRDLFLIPDRTAAMEKAFCMAKEGDTVLLLGKGHEASIIYKDGPKHWDEKLVAEAVLEKISQ